MFKSKVSVFALIFVFVFVFHNTGPCDLLLVFEPAGQNWRNFAMRLNRSGGCWGLPAVMGLVTTSLMTGCKYKVVFVFDLEETCHGTRSIGRLVGPSCCHGTFCKKSHDRMQMQK